MTSMRSDKARRRHRVGFGRSSDEQDKRRVMKALQSFLRPEFINRVDEIINISPADQGRILPALPALCCVS